jgi:hypothetical protein
MASTVYKEIDISRVREAWGIVQCLGAPNELQSTISPTESECQNAVDHIRNMRKEISKEYTCYAKLIAVRYMNDKWDTDGQVELKITRWPDALKYLHHLRDINDLRWEHVYQLKSGSFCSGQQHCPARWLVDHTSEKYNARVDAEMQSDLNLQFIQLHGIKNAQSEHLQLLCRTKYGDTVNNNIDKITAMYCGIKLTLDLPSQKGKHRLLNLVPGVNGEKTYHYVQYNGKINDNESITITSGARERELDGEQQTEEKEICMLFLERMLGRPWVNPNMMRQGPYDVLKYLIESNMVLMDMVPKFVVWEKQFISESMSDVTNPLLLFAELADRENQHRVHHMEQHEGLTGDETNCEMYNNTIKEFHLSGSEDKINKATLLNNNQHLLNPAEHFQLLRTENGELGQEEDGSKPGNEENNNESKGVKPMGNELQKERNGKEDRRAN